MTPDPVSLTSDEEATARRSLHAVGRIVVLVLLLGGVGFAVTVQVENVPDIEWHLRPGWLALSALAFTLLQLVHAALWRRILVDLHGHIGLSRGVALWSVSALGKYVPTSVLLFVTRIAMAEKAGVPRRVTAASMAYELPITTAAALVIGAYGVIELPALEDEPLRWAVIAAPLVALAAMHPRVFGRVARLLLRRMGADDEMPELLAVRRILRLGGLYALSFLIAGAGTYAFARGLHPVAAGDIPAIVSSFAIALVLSYVGFLLPAGIGAREVGYAAALATALPAAVAMAVAIGVRLLQMAIEVVFALVSPLVAQRAER